MSFTPPLRGGGRACPEQPSAGVPCPRCLDAHPSGRGDSFGGAWRGRLRWVLAALQALGLLVGWLLCLFLAYVLLKACQGPGDELLETLLG